MNIMGKNISHSNIVKEMFKYIAMLKQSVVLVHEITVWLIEQIVLQHTKYIHKNYLMAKMRVHHKVND